MHLGYAILQQRQVPVVVEQPGLDAGSQPATSAPALIAAGITLAVLTPLACAKRRLGAR